MTLVLGIPATVLNLIQAGVLERAFHDGLFPELKFRSEAMMEEWPQHAGNEMYMSRPGLIPVNTTPLAPGQDPDPQTVAWEQWKAELARWGNSVDTHAPTSATASANLFLRNIHQLGLNAGQTLNRLPRNSLFQAYLSGHTTLIDAAGAGDTQVHVSAINGFEDVILLGTNVKPEPVGITRALPITITTVGGPAANTVIGVIPDSMLDPKGPGRLILGAAVGGGGALARSPVISSQAPRIIRAGGGASVDAIGAADSFVIQHGIVAANMLRNANVPPHEDGFYHCHIGPLTNAQAFSDVPFQRLFTSLPNSDEIRMGVLGVIGNVKYIINSEIPQLSNTGARTATSANARYAKDIGSEIVNDTGIEIGRTIITGKGAIYEKWLNEDAYVTEAGVTGKIGEFDIVNNGMNIPVDRVKLIMRAPVNRMQDMVATSWSCSTSFPIPSDITGPSGPERFKRAIVVEHAL